MPFIGLGLHVLIALFFAVHALRTGRSLFWLMILFCFPLLGSVVYFIVEYLPQSRLSRRAGHAASQVGKAAMGFLDPEREHREAAAAFDLAPTAQNKIRLAKAALDKGNAAEAAMHYRDALKGPFSSDPELRFGLASALVTEGSTSSADEALQTLQALQATQPGYRLDETMLLTARALALQGRTVETRQSFEATLARYNTVEARARFVAWLAQQGDESGARQQLEALQKDARQWTPLGRTLNQGWMQLAEGALH